MGSDPEDSARVSKILNEACHVFRGRSYDRGVVKKVILPATDDAADWSLPAGGVLIEGGGLGLFTTESLEQDEDVDFVSRALSASNRGDAG